MQTVSSSRWMGPEKNGRPTTGRSEQIVHTAARSSVYVPGVMWGKVLQHILSRSTEWDEC